MKLIKAIIHNFRSIKDGVFEINPYTVLVGENNAGKTNFLSAINIFYDQIKFEYDRDFPKFKADNDSWIELHFEITQEEQHELENKSNILKLRKYLYSKNRKPAIYHYNGESVSNKEFKNKDILGKVIYIPSLNKVDDHMKTSGPSTFRELISFIMKGPFSNSDSFNDLINSFNKCNESLKKDKNGENSILSLQSIINEELSLWDIEFDMDINPIDIDNIIKNLLQWNLKDRNLIDQKLDISSMGQGFQRSLIVTLIKQLANFKNKKSNNNCTIILFEEPEAFLHPSKQDILYNDLIELTQISNQQVIISTHSTHFVSNSVNNFLSVCRLGRTEAETKVYQITKTKLNEITQKNKTISSVCKSNNTNENQIDDNDYQELNNCEEFIKYMVWLDSERSALFFSRHVIICEGVTEKVYLNILTNNSWDFLINKHVYILDAQGKFNIHRYINLFTALGIPHSVLFDGDDDKHTTKVNHKTLNKFIQNSKTNFTTKIHKFNIDFEEFLGIKRVNQERRDLKPINILKDHKNNNISEEKQHSLKEIIETMVTSQ